MIAFFTGLSLRTWLTLGAAALAVSVVVGAYHAGKRVERAEQTSRNLQTSIDALRGRRETNEKVQSLTDDQLCVALGGRMREGHCE